MCQMRWPRRVARPFTVAENAPDAIPGAAGPVLGLITLSDPDMGDTHTVTVDDDRFQVIRHPAEGMEGSSLWLTLKPGVTLDYEASASIDLTLTVTDAGGLTGTADVTITVTDVNEPPSAPALDAADGALTVAENDEAGGNIGTLSSSDPEGGKVTFSVDDPHFEIETLGDTAVLKYKAGAGIDYEGEKVVDGKLTIMLTATDGDGLVSEAKPVEITVTNVNEAPEIKVAGAGDADSTAGGITASFTQPENTDDAVPGAAGAVLGLITLSDPDAGDTHTVTVDDDRFQVIDHAGAKWLTLKAGQSLDFEEAASIDLTLTVTDAGGLTGTAEVTIAVTNVNEAPMIEVVDSTTPDGMPARSNIPENEAGVPVGEIKVSDEDAADQELGKDDITLSGAGAMYFEVSADADGGLWLKLKDGVSLNFEETPSVTVEVTVADNEGLKVSDTVTVTVGNINEPPGISVDGAMIAENKTGKVGTVTVTDNEEMRDITLDVEDIRVVGRDDFEVVETASGDYELRLTKALDFESDAVMKEDDFTGYVEVVLEIKDEGLAGSDPITTMETIRVTITNEDEAPTISVMDGETPDGRPAVSVIDENSNADGDVPVGLITASDPEDGDFTAEDIMITGADAESFTVKADDEGMLWLMLKQGASADHEADEGSLTATLTVDDGTNAPASTTFMLTIENVNEAPIASGTAKLFVDHDKDPKTPDEPEGDLPPTYSWNVDEEKSYRIDVTDLFKDEDGDTLFDYSIRGEKPEWLELAEERVDGRSIITLGGEPEPKDRAGYWEVELVATDQGGASGSFPLKIIADDGNDRITGITFANADGEDSGFFEADVDENVESGVFIGTFSAADPDDPRHANGMTTWKVENDDRFEIDKMTGRLSLSTGKRLDHEAEGGIDLKVTAVDGGDPESTMTIDFTVNVVDRNDAPKAGLIGNWWVTVDEDLDTGAEKGDADFIEKGSWLSFSLETWMRNADGTVARDARPAFTDDDIAGEDTLTYSLVSGPSWLGIDPATGALFNKEGMAATETDIETVRVRATDKAGESAEATFRIAVVVSDRNDSGAFTDNDSPDIKADERDIPENAKAGTVVATFTVTDDDLPVGEIHPWGRLSVSIQTEAQGDSLDQAPGILADMDPSNDLFTLHHTGTSGDTASYEVRLTELGADRLNADEVEGVAVDEVTLTIRAADGSFAGDLDTISASSQGADITTVDFKIDDVNEPPSYMPDDPTDSSALTGANTKASPLTFTVEQQQDPARIYLNLTKLFGDPDRNHDDEDISFTARLSQTPWLKFASFWNEDEGRMQSGPQEWGHIRYGRDEEPGGTDANEDITWLSGATDPDDGDIVLIIDVDRDGSDLVQGTARPDPAEIAQDADGLITITATDEDNASSATEIVVAVKDENLPARGDGVSVSDKTPAQGQRLTIQFNEEVDPDFTGSEAVAGNPVLVVYTWTNAGADGAGTDVVQESIDNSGYLVKPTDVGDMLKAAVRYYELYDDPDTAAGFDLVLSASDDDDALAALDDTSGAVRDRPDAATGTFSVTTSASELVITLNGHKDDDGLDGVILTHAWEFSSNGVGGWQVFADSDASTPYTTAIGEAQQNTYVRLVVTYEDDGGFNERLVSQPVKVGAIDTKAAPAINDGTSGNDTAIPAGRILRLDGLDATKVDKGAITVEWIAGGKTVHTGETYTVKAADRGSINVKVTTRDENGGLVSIVESESRDLVAQATPNSPPVVNPDASKTFDLGAAPDKDGVFKSLSGTIDLASLFNDIEGIGSYAFGAPTGGGFGADLIAAGVPLDLYADLDDPRSDQILVVNEATGAIEYRSTQAQDHGGDVGDGAGNFIIMPLTATDKGGEAVSTNVMLRIDAAATGIEVDGTPATPATAAMNKPYALMANAAGYADSATALTEEITVKADDKGVQTNPQVAAMIDVQDDNEGKHKYGQYDFKVVGEWAGVFEVVRDKADGSMATLRLATGAKLDFEAIKGTPDDDGNKSIVVHVEATPVDMANSGFKVQSVGITVKVADDPNDGDNVISTQPPGSNKVPGLKDDAGETHADDTDDADGGDDDEDGGTPPPMDTMTMSTLDDGLF